MTSAYRAQLRRNLQHGIELHTLMVFTEIEQGVHAKTQCTIGFALRFELHPDPCQPALVQGDGLFQRASDPVAILWTENTV